MDWEGRLRRACPALFEEGFAPAWWCRGFLAQSVAAEWAHRTPSPLPSARRETLGRCAIDWIDRPPSDVVVLVFPHCGHSVLEEDHSLASRVVDVLGCTCGWVVYPHLGGLPPSTKEALPGAAYASGKEGKKDVGKIVRAARRAHPGAKLVVVGLSYGTAVFVGWAATRPKASRHVSAALLMGYGHSFCATTDALDAYRVLWWPLSHWVLRPWRGAAERAGQSSRASASTFREWDATRYARPSLRRYSVPTLFLNSEDDVLTPAGRLVGKGYERPHMVRVATERGGHLGWVDGQPYGRSWIDRVVVQFVTLLEE